MSVGYQELATACQVNNVEAARAAVAKYHVNLTRDKNLGLANQVLARLYKNNIQRLTKTFLTLSLADVASRVQLQSAEAAEQHILNMVSNIFFVLLHIDLFDCTF